MTAPANRKRFTLEEIAALLGNRADERIVAALLRKKTRKIFPITPEQIERTLKYLSEEKDEADQGSFMVFATSARKWIFESPKAMKVFKAWLTKLQTAAATDGQERKVTRGRKKAQ